MGPPYLIQTMSVLAGLDVASRGWDVSRTYRRQLISNTLDQGHVVNHLGHNSQVRDGRQSVLTIVRRGNRSTGLPEHRQFRARAKVERKLGNDEVVASGKKRRYGDRYGTCEW